MGSWAFNAAGFQYWSSELFRIHGLDPGNEPPTVEEYLALVHPEDRTFMEEGIKTSLADHHAFDFTKRIVRPDGEIRHVRCVGVPIMQGGMFHGFFGTGIDVTEHELLEQEKERLRQLETELAHTNRVSMLGEMAASLAHEIKQPIAAAMTSANSCIEWLEHEPPNLDRARAAAAKIDKYGNRAAEIIDRIRSFYKKSPPQRGLVDVNGIIQEMLTLLKGEADRYSIAMRTELVAELPKIKADRVQLQQVFMNLMLNAIEAMRDEGGETYGEVAAAGRPTAVLGPRYRPGTTSRRMLTRSFLPSLPPSPKAAAWGWPSAVPLWNRMAAGCGQPPTSGRGATFHFTLPTEVREPSSLDT